MDTARVEPKLTLEQVRTDMTTWGTDGALAVDRNGGKPTIRQPSSATKQKGLSRAQWPNSSPALLYAAMTGC